MQLLFAACGLGRYELRRKESAHEDYSQDRQTKRTLGHAHMYEIMVTIPVMNQMYEKRERSEKNEQTA